LGSQRSRPRFRLVASAWLAPPRAAPRPGAETVQVTFPVWIWGTIRNNLPPQVNVIGTIIFVAAITLVGVTTLLQARSAAKSYREGAT